ncbi:threonine--tRNA ligase [Deferrisoma camini]|uniref:threonine--tRNA ligase n=1 Tax=Deferrisoma camini TaxID=1035120 RepID=UPI00046D33FE|nr:threonine--tRNA ligase [Deferrisoma camini]
MTIRVTLPDGSVKELPRGASPLQVAEAIGKRLAREAVAAEVDGRLVDLTAPLEADCRLRILTGDTPEGLDVLRHSASHVMAQAAKRVLGEVKLAIGPATADGFYYDLDTPRPLTPDDLEAIEAEMARIVKEDLPVRRRELPREEALRFFRERGESYKVELIEDLPDEDTISLYEQGEFADLCRGPHVPSTGRVKVFKLLSVAGAYWRGDERNPMLQRIYGTAFPTKEQLKERLRLLEEAKKRDHRKLGRELDLFSIEDEVGPGLVIWHPKGALVRTLLEDFERREHLRRGYQIVIGPQLLRRELWERSGHYDNYRENMYFTEVEGQAYGIKPMNCLAHMVIYRSRVRSYRELPLRFFELGTVHRHEKSGVLHGLTRVRGFTQDDAHILCTPDQLLDEISGILDFVQDVMGLFGFEYEVELSTRPEKSIGDDQAWERATRALEEALRSRGMEFGVCEGEGAFYGPKIDVKLRDALDRKWQCATIQADFTLPERFDLTYVGPDGERHRPVMLHRVILGSIERFIGVLIEHFAGAFPTWLAPVQVVLLPIADRHVPYARKAEGLLRSRGVRVEVDARNETLRYKIREAQVQKVPYMVVLGDREVSDGTVSPRPRSGDPLPTMALDEFVERVAAEADLPRLEDRR